MQPDAKKSKKTVLSGNESRLLLEKFGLPLVPQESARRIPDAVTAAQKLGFPAVVKGIGENLLHKTDRGLVHINLPDSRAVENAARLDPELAGPGMTS